MSTNDSNDAAEGSIRLEGLTNEIANASTEQSKGLSQLNIAVAEQDKLVQQNAAEAVSSEETAKNLNDQALRLDEMIGELSALVGGVGAQALIAESNTPKTSTPLLSE